MRMRILYHDHCFDGAASAAFFSRFIEAKFHPEAEFAFTGLAHKASQLFEPGLFDGDENAIVDFKYSTDPRLTWWFDHHQSAFLTPEDAEHFRRDTSGRKMYDPNFRSCTKYIATIAREQFDFEAPDVPTVTDLRVSLPARYPIRTALLFARHRFYAEESPRVAQDPSPARRPPETPVNPLTAELPPAGVERARDNRPAPQPRLAPWDVPRRPERVAAPEERPGERRPEPDRDVPPPRRRRLE